MKRAVASEAPIVLNATERKSKQEEGKISVMLLVYDYNIVTALISAWNQCFYQRKPINAALLAFGLINYCLALQTAAFVRWTWCCLIQFDFVVWKREAETSFTQYWWVFAMKWILKMFFIVWVAYWILEKLTSYWKIEQDSATNSLIPLAFQKKYVIHQPEKPIARSKSSRSNWQTREGSSQESRASCSAWFMLDSVQNLDSRYYVHMSIIEFHSWLFGIGP